MEIGERHGRLVCLGKDPDKDYRYYLYKCDCGNVKSIIQSNVKRGATTSCGCYLIANRMNGNCHRTYGYSHTRIDHIYKSMIDRCENPKNYGYHKYGGRGIRVCEEWKANKLAFFEWAFTNGYAENLTIDRKDNSKGYSPENCRWITYQEQNNNRRSNHHETINGETRTIAEWSRISGIAQTTIGARLKSGWTPKDAVFKPIERSSHGEKTIRH
jgi:hypothetical protein